MTWTTYHCGYSHKVVTIITTTQLWKAKRTLMVICSNGETVCYLFVIHWMPKKTVQSILQTIQTFCISVRKSLASIRSITTSVWTVLTPVQMVSTSVWMVFTSVHQLEVSVWRTAASIRMVWCLFCSSVQKEKIKLVISLQIFSIAVETLQSTSMWLNCETKD